MGKEGKDKSEVGLCNAVILSAPNSGFLKLWYEKHHSFEAKKWNYHSVRLPGELASEQPSLVSVQPYDTFHWPFWDAAGIKLMLGSFEYDYKNNKAVHMWRHGVERSAYKDFSLAWCFECHSTLVSMLQAYVPDPLFSVVLPCAKHTSALEETLKSVLAQRITFWELVIVDDQSPDHCGTLSKNWATKNMNEDQLSRLHIVANAQKRGTAESWNVGIRQSKGVWICALDVGTRLSPDYFSNVSSAMSFRPDIQVFYSDEGSSPTSAKVRTIPDFAKEPGRAVWEEVPWAPIFLRSSWAAVGGYSAVLPWGREDLDFWLGLCEFGAKLEKFPHALVYHQSVTTADENRHSKEEMAMVRTRHPLLHMPTQLLDAHQQVAAMPDATRERLLRVQPKDPGSAPAPPVSEDDAFVLFWLALSDFYRGSSASAEHRLLRIGIGQNISESSALLSWQPQILLLRCLCARQDLDGASRVLSALNRTHAELTHTSSFRQLDTGCRDAAHWLPSVPAHDTSR